MNLIEIPMAVFGFGIFLGLIFSVATFFGYYVSVGVCLYEMVTENDDLFTNRKPTTWFCLRCLIPFYGWVYAIRESVKR